jgi:hypothetical protein
MEVLRFAAASAYRVVGAIRDFCAEMVNFCFDI